MSKIKFLYVLQIVHIIAYKIYIWHILLSQKEWIFKHLQNKVKHIYTKYIWSSKPILPTDFCMRQHGLESMIVSLIQLGSDTNWRKIGAAKDRRVSGIRIGCDVGFKKFLISETLWWWLDERHPLIIIHISQDLSRNHKDRIFMLSMHEHEVVP